MIAKEIAAQADVFKKKQVLDESGRKVGFFVYKVYNITYGPVAQKYLKSHVVGIG